MIIVTVTVTFQPGLENLRKWPLQESGIPPEKMEMVDGRNKNKKVPIKNKVKLNGIRSCGNLEALLNFNSVTIIYNLL